MTDSKGWSTLDRALELAASERRRQVFEEGFSLEEDRKYKEGELSSCAACYAIGSLDKHGVDLRAFWPFSLAWWKPRSRKENLVKAAALILAELECIISEEDEDAAIIERA